MDKSKEVSSQIVCEKAKKKEMEITKLNNLAYYPNGLENIKKYLKLSVLLRLYSN